MLILNFTNKLVTKDAVNHYVYETELHQICMPKDEKPPTKLCETFWSNILGCTVVMTLDQDGIGVSLVDEKVVHYTTLGGHKP